MSFFDSLDASFLINTINLLDDVADYRRSECVSKLWRSVSRNARPTQLYLEQPRSTAAGVAEKQTLSIVRWLQDKLSTQLLGDLQRVYLQDVGCNKHACSDQPLAAAVSLCLGCTSIIQISIRDCASLQVAWLPATVTHLMVEGELDVDSATLTRTFPGLQVLHMDSLLMHCDTIDTPFLHLSCLKVRQLRALFPLRLNENLVNMFPVLQYMQCDVGGSGSLGGHTEDFVDAVVAMPSLKHVIFIAVSVFSVPPHRKDLVVDVQNLHFVLS